MPESAAPWRQHPATARATKTHARPCTKSRSSAVEQRFHSRYYLGCPSKGSSRSAVATIIATAWLVVAPTLTACDQVASAPATPCSDISDQLVEFRVTEGRGGAEAHRDKHRENHRRVLARSGFVDRCESMSPANLASFTDCMSQADSTVSATDCLATSGVFTTPIGSIQE